MGPLHEYVSTFMIIFRSVLRVRNASDTSCTENKTKIFRKSCSLRDNVEKYGTSRQTTDGKIMWRMRFASWITKTTDTHQEYVIILAFPLPKWFHAHALMLRHM
jgi:hypothetical protein